MLLTFKLHGLKTSPHKLPRSRFSLEASMLAESRTAFSKVTGKALFWSLLGTLQGSKSGNL